MSKPVLNAIADRRSIRAYRPEQITRAELDALLKAAVESPSANNAQPWHFSVVQDRSVYAQISAAASKTLGTDLGDVFYNAPTTIFISADADNRWHQIDTGIAVQNIALAAEGLGLGSVILGLPVYAFEGSEGSSFNQLLKIPAGYEFVIAIALGYPIASKEAHSNKPNLISFI
jgi:nitroreductase